jgi:hypothetical protein
MKRLSAAYGLTCVLPLVAHAAALPNYSGTWVLDTYQTRDLPPNVKMTDLVVTQDPQKLTVRTNRGEIIYNLDGTESTIQIQGGTATASLAKKNDEKIVLHTKKEIVSEGKRLTFTTTETWELRGEGKRLKVISATKGPNGVQELTLFFRLKK